MSVHRTPNGSWTYDFEYLKRRFRERFKTREAALRGEMQKRAAVDNKYYVNENLTFKDAAALFFEKHSKNKVSCKTDEGQIKVLNELFGEKRIADITPIDIEDMRKYLEEKGLKSVSVDHYHTLVKAIFNRMIMWRKFSGFNPANAVKLKRDPNTHIRSFDQNEIKLIEKNMTREIYPYFIGALHTGMRRGELCNLTWENVSLTSRDIYVAKSKSGKARHIPTSETLQCYLQMLSEKKKNPMDFVFGTLSRGYITYHFATE